MKRILVTGFEPFGGEKINSSWEAVLRLPDKIGEYELSKAQLPVVFGAAADRATELARGLHPDIILCIGQAGGRDAVTPELVGINLRYASIPDNAGRQPKDEPVSEGGREAYFSTLPVRRITEAINASGILSRVSYSAGAFVCNDVLYTLLEHFYGSDTRVGFIHVPCSSEQEKEPSMNIENIVRALEVAIKSIDP